MRPILLILALVASVGTSHADPAISLGRGINLDNWDVWPPEEKWGDPTVILPFPEWRKHLMRKGMRKLSETGFDFVRMPIDPRPFLSPQSQDLHDELKASVKAAIDTALDGGLNVVLDLHTLPDAAGSAGIERILGRPQVFSMYRDLVASMAGLAATYPPSRVALELVNEPVIDCEGTSDWPPLQKELHKAARASAPQTTLVMTGACWGGADQLVRMDPALVGDDNTLWSFHFYQPFVMTHQGATWAGNFAPYVTGLPWPWHEVPEAERNRIASDIRKRIDRDAPLHLRDGHKATLDALLAEIDTAAEYETEMSRSFDDVAQWAAANGIDPSRILVGEFGMIRQEYGSDYIHDAGWRAAYYGDVIARVEEKGFAWAMWSYGGAFGIVDTYGQEKAEPDVLDVVRALDP